VAFERLPSRVLVTGGAGFIGWHSVRALHAEGATVMVLDDLRHHCGVPLPSEVELVTAELSTAEAARAVEGFRPQACLHLAAQGGVSRSVRDPAGDALVNVVGTVALLKACASAGCRRIAFASSGGAIYGHADRLPSPETALARPLSPYGAAKLAGEGYLGMFSRTFGLSGVALRYSNVYGPFQDGTGEAGLVAISCQRLLNGRPPQVRGDGEQTRDFIFVGDIVAANLLALASDVSGPINIGTGVGSSVRRVVEELSRVAGFEGRPDHVAAREGEVRHTFLDIRRAKRLLRWQAQTSLSDGLRETYVSFRQRLVPSSGAAATTGTGGAAAVPGRESPAGSG
jgi:UDP-glucose 4-epimerase